MKNCLFSAILISLLSLAASSQLQAQQHVLKINPASLILSTANLQYEYALNDQMSFQLGLLFTVFSYSESGTDVGFQGIGVTPEFRYYLSDTRKGAPRGLYAGPYLRYINLNINVNDEINQFTGSWNSINGGVIAGYQWLIDDVFAIDVFLGGGLGSGNLTGNVNEEQLRLLRPGLLPSVRAGFSLGVAL